MNDSQKEFSPFPSFLATREQKSKDEFGLQYARAIWSEYVKNGTLYNTRRARDIENRKYAEGLESVQKYKDRLDLNGDTSFLNLDFNPVNRIASIVDNIVGKMMNQEYKITCTPVDPESKTQFDDYRSEMYANMFLQKYSEETEALTGIPLVPKGKNIPKSNEEAELDLKLKYKPAASIAMEKAIQFVFMNNDSEDIRRKILKDLVVLKRAATYRYYDEDGNIRYEYVDPLDIITPYSKYEDFRNIPYQALQKQYTIEKLSQINPKFTDEDLFYIAKSQAGKNKNPSWNWSDSYEGYYQPDGISGSRPYYNFNVMVLEFYFITINKEVRIKKKKSKGGFFFEKKSDNYTGEILPESISVIDNITTWSIKGEKDMIVGKEVAKNQEEAKVYFAKVKNDRRNANSETITKQMEYLYQGCWIPDTKYIFNYKLAKNIDRENISGSYSPKCELPIVMIAPDIRDMENKSLVERMIPHEDQINLINLKTQQLLIKAKPPGVAIDLEGMDAVVLGMGDGKNAKMDGIEITRQYEQTGSYTFRSRDKNGNPINGSVITPLDNGIGRDFATLFSAYNMELQKMNDVIGYNSAVDGSSPDAKSLVGTQKMAIQATNNSLRPIYQASMNLIVRQAKRISLMIQDSVAYNNEAFIGAIGRYSTETLKYGKKIAFNQFAIDIELLPNDEEKMQIEEQIRLGQMSNPPLLYPSDVIRVREVLKENVKMAGQLMVLLEDKNIKNRMKESAALQEQNGQIQIQSAQASAQASAQLDQIITQNKIALLNEEYKLKNAFEMEQFNRQVEIQRLKNEGANTVAVINSESKVNVQNSANEGKIIAQQVANEGKKEGLDKQHSNKLSQTAFENALIGDKKLL